MIDHATHSVHVNHSEPTDALAALEFREQCEGVLSVAETHREASMKEEAVLHEVAEELRIVQEESSEKEREVRRLKVRLEQLTRMREEYRVWSDSQLDDARRTAEATEDAVRAASIGTAGPTLRDAAEVDDLRLHLNELKNQRTADIACMEDKLRREQEARELHEQSVQKELRLALEAMEKLREDTEKRVEEMSREDQARHGGS